MIKSYDQILSNWTKFMTETKWPFNVQQICNNEPRFLRDAAQKHILAAVFKWWVLASLPALTDLTCGVCEASEPCETVSACLLRQAEHVYYICLENNQHTSE